MDKQKFIDMLASKLGRPTPESLPPPVELDPSLFTIGDTDRVKTFLQTWESLGGKGVYAHTPSEAAYTIKKWLGEPQPFWLSETSIIAWQEMPDFAEKTFTVLGWPILRYNRTLGDSPTAAAAHAELGVTGADWGISVSGSLVLKSSPARGRSVSLLPPRHLTFIHEKSLLDNLFQLTEELDHSGHPPSAVELISGPSRTSDIEMDLSIGVHGPIEVYVIVVST